ncbi:hypothetical protein MTF65_03805 [Streptomyces sp. APSN-46.1]|uniref:hypothetical protein n=1 Tax=Streptomyces sp. APSN-46.1 TaxID=2929049 RepID=UPI001FB46E57|nr:hypothetical protein [Streptomyces sp. APSN-46.1]MCJ1676488.1 hypothetical protein [Streptomyces sp. APSN-46.1]
MTIHRPGLPGDLPAAEVLWARWALVAALEATTEAEGHGIHRTGHWIDVAGLHLDDSGCTWWTMSRLGEGRYVLYGEDESSGVKWHEPAIDMLAQGPDWLPYETLRGLLEGWELGCVYWYENGAWARAPYPEGLGDDGLDCGMSRFVEREEALTMVTAVDHGPHPVDDRTAAALLEAAENYRLAADTLESLVSDFGGGEECDRDLPAMQRALHLAGLTAGAASVR